MDNRFLIYIGFQNDVNSLFDKLIKKFDLKIVYKSDSGVFFINEHTKLEITYETGLQIWLITKNKEPEMLAKLCMNIGKELYAQYKKLLFSMNDSVEIKKKSFQNLSKFLIENFESEFSPTSARL